MDAASPPTRGKSGPLAIVLMGVSGSGKTVVGKALADRLGAAFLDGDDLHPPANVAKMASGVPLVDEDRWPWLDAIGRAIRGKTAADRNVVVACSALRRVYRDRLCEAAGQELVFLLLDGSRETLAKRLATRKGHFMPPSLLASQLATLERPQPGERAATISIEAGVQTVVEEALDALRGMPVVPGN